MHPHPAGLKAKKWGFTDPNFFLYTGRRVSQVFRFTLITMGNLKKKRRLKMSKHKRRKRLKSNRHKKRTW